jgi:type I restriction enzyme, S subunit
MEVTNDVLPPNWSLVTIDDVADVNPHGAKYDNLSLNLPVSFVPMAAVDEKQGAISNPSILPLARAKRGHTRFIEGDVIFARITPCMENGKVAIARGLSNGLGFGSTEFHILRPKRIVMPEYLFHFMRQERFRMEAAAHMTGTVGQKRVPAEYLRNAPFPLAPINEQRKIVVEIKELFRELRTAREAILKVPSTTKQIRHIILKKAFQGELTHRLPNDESAEHIIRRLERMRPRNRLYHKTSEMESDLQDAVAHQVPKEWSWTTLGKIFELRSGGTPRRSEPKYWNGSVPWISSGEVAFCEIWNTKEKITELGSNNSNAKLLPPGSVLLALFGEGKTRGQAAILRIPATVNQAIVAMLCSQTPIPSEYVYWWLYYRYEETRKIRGGTNQPNMYMRNVSNIPIPIAPLKESKQIVSRIEDSVKGINKVEDTVRDQQSKMIMLEQSILTKAFKGELVPQDPNDEPAAELLERPNAESMA